MRNKVAQNRSYVKGLNTETYTSMYCVNGLKEYTQRLFNGDTLSKYHLGEMSVLLGQLERFHAPKEKGKQSNSELWVGSACNKNIDGWQQWIQIQEIEDTRIVPLGSTEPERIKAQTIMVGQDTRRAHIEWGSGRTPGYIHSSTSRYMDTDEFLETTPPPPPILQALPVGMTSMSDYTIFTAELFKSADDYFKWYDSNSATWYIFVLYKIEIDDDILTYVCVYDMNHLYNALSGFDKHCVTVSETSCENESDAGMYIVQGTMRIDGTYEGKHRTAILMTSSLDEDVVYNVVMAKLAN